VRQNHLGIVSEYPKTRILFLIKRGLAGALGKDQKLAACDTIPGNQEQKNGKSQLKGF
jgi:hypothetical protein